MGPSCWDASESQGHRSHKENPLHSRFALREQAARESVVCSHSPSPAAGAPVKTCFNSLSSLWSIFIDWGRPRILVSIRLTVPNMGQLSASRERIWAPPGRWTQLPRGWQWPAEPLVSRPPVWRGCLSGPWGSQYSHSGNALPLLLVLSLSWHLSTPPFSLLSCCCPFLSREWTLDGYSITPLSLGDHAPSDWQWRTLTGD